MKRIVFKIFLPFLRNKREKSGLSTEESKTVVKKLLVHI